MCDVAPLVLTHFPPVHTHIYVLAIPQLMVSLGDINSWQYNSFQLEDVSGGRPLSCLAFHLMKKMDIIKRFHLDETKLARWE